MSEPIKESDCIIETHSSSAPISEVRITHIPTGVSVAHSGPSRHKNLAAAWDMLRVRVTEKLNDKTEKHDLNVRRKK